MRWIAFWFFALDANSEWIGKQIMRKNDKNYSDADRKNKHTYKLK